MAKKINNNISKKFLANDKILESMAAQLEGFNSIIKNQLSFNKMIETQVALLASSCPNINAGKLPGQPEAPPKENVSAVTTRGGRTTQEPPFPQDAGKQRKTVTASHTKVEVSLAKACHGFDRHEFCGLILGQVVHGKFAPRCNGIQIRLFV